MISIRLLLICSMGLSSHALCGKINEAARQEGLPLTAEPVAALRLHEKLKEADILLLEPQVAYLKAELEPLARQAGIPLDIVNSFAFATMNGTAVLNQVRNLLARRGEKRL
jgi:PTS system cellobiose-specific IIB component